MLLQGRDEKSRKEETAALAALDVTDKLLQLTLRSTKSLLRKVGLRAAVEEQRAGFGDAGASKAQELLSTSVNVVRKK